MKLRNLLPIFAVIVIASISNTYSQSRYFVLPDGSDTKTTTTVTTTPVPVATNTTVQQQPVQTVQPTPVTPQTNPTKQQREPKYNDKLQVEATSTSSLMAQYQALEHEKEILIARMRSIVVELEGASKSLTKELGKELAETTTAIEVVEKKMSMFPPHIRQGNTKAPLKYDAAFQHQLNEMTQVKASQTDPYAGQISTDIQLEQVYREYLANSSQQPIINSATGTMAPNYEEVKYRIMIAITNVGLQKNAFGNMIDIFEQRLQNGVTIYYQGAYNTIQEAQNACNNIITYTQFKDAFVVAMRGNQRIALPRYHQPQQQPQYQYQQYNQYR